MYFFSPAEAVRNYVDNAHKKTGLSVEKTILLAMFAGLVIAFGDATANIVSACITNPSVSRILCGVLFPGALTLVIITGAELFTGNALLLMGVFEHKITMQECLRNWLLVYLGNFIGSILPAIVCAYFGEMNYAGGAVAVATMRTAAAKVSMPFVNALMLGICCNVLVCMAVFATSEAKDMGGKVLSLFFPIVFFVVGGFEHSIANMYYIPAGILAAHNPAYASLAMEAGVDVSALGWGAFIWKNLLPVTIGNILGGGAVALMMWRCYLCPEKAAERETPRAVRGALEVSADMVKVQ